MSEFGILRMKVSSENCHKGIMALGSFSGFHSLIACKSNNNKCHNPNSQHMVFTSCHVQLIISVAGTGTSFFWVQRLFRYPPHFIFLCLFLTGDLVEQLLNTYMN